VYFGRYCSKDTTGHPPAAAPQPPYFPDDKGRRYALPRRSRILHISTLTVRNQLAIAIRKLAAALPHTSAPNTSVRKSIIISYTQVPSAPCFNTEIKEFWSTRSYNLFLPLYPHNRSKRNPPCSPCSHCTSVLKTRRRGAPKKIFPSLWYISFHYLSVGLQYLTYDGKNAPGIY